MIAQVLIPNLFRHITFIEEVFVILRITYEVLNKILALMRRFAYDKLLIAVTKFGANEVVIFLLFFVCFAQFDTGFLWTFNEATERIVI